ncbi:MAG: EamA family transporter [Roseococcus sp.]
MPRSTDIALTALAPAIWGSTYLVTTELLAGWDSLTLAFLRALPAGLLLLAVMRALPQGIWWARALVLGVLNFAFFWVMLFISAHRLPGGVAATVGAIQPLFVLLLAGPALGAVIRPAAVAAALAGMLGVALLVLAPGAGLDMPGIAAGLAGAVAMAGGTVLTRKWQPPVPLLTFTAWQLTAGGLVLLPFLLWAHPGLPELTARGMTGLVYLGLIGAAGTYILWFRGIARLGPGVVAPLGLLSPVSAVLLGWVVLGQTLSPLQILGMAVVIGSIVASQFLQPPAPAKA